MKAVPGAHSFRFGRTGLEEREGVASGSRWAFADSVLRGVGQVIFLNNSYSGALCLLAILLSAPSQAALAVLGTTVSTFVGQKLGADAREIRKGLYGYNGCLAALGVPLFLGPSLASVALAVVAAGLSSWLLLLCRRFVGADAPILTAPFVLCAWAVILLYRAVFAAESSAGPPVGSLRDVPVPNPGILADWSLVESALAGLAQVYLQPTALSGLCVAVALLVGSRVVFIMAICAAAISAVVAFSIGVPQEAVRTGLLGFNAVLAAVALGATYQGPNGGSFLVALGVAAVMPVFQLACGSVLILAGLPTTSAPFILATWAVLALAFMGRQFRHGFLRGRE